MQATRTRQQLVAIACVEGELEVIDRPEESVAPAAASLAVPVIALPDGEGPPARNGECAYVVVEGLLLRRLTVASGHSVELLAPGSVLLPGREDAASFARVEWRAAEPVRLAGLDLSSGSPLQRAPALLTAVLRRAIDRSRALAVQSAAMSIVGVEERLQALLWALAERWGSVTPDGVELELRVHQATLAELVGARRPTVNVALGRLCERGALLSREPGCWLLKGDPPAAAG